MILGFLERTDDDPDTILDRVGLDPEDALAREAWFSVVVLFGWDSSGHWSGV